MLYDRVYIVRTGRIGNVTLRAGAWHDLPVDLANKARALRIARDGPFHPRFFSDGQIRSMANDVRQREQEAVEAEKLPDAAAIAEANALRQQSLLRIEAQKSVDPKIVADENECRRARLSKEAT